MDDLSFLDLTMDDLHPSIMNEEIFRTLQRTGWSREPRSRLVALTMHEVVPTEYSGIIEGPDCALGMVFGIEFINSHETQPIGSVFYRRNVPVKDIAEQVELYVKDLIKCELFVMATISNVTTNIKQCVEYLIVKSSYFHSDIAYGPLVYSIANMDIVHLYDPVSLMEQSRDILFCWDVVYEVCGQVTRATVTDFVKMFNHPKCIKVVKGYFETAHPSDPYFALKLFSATAYYNLHVIKSDDSQNDQLGTTHQLVSLLDLIFDTLNGSVDKALLPCDVIHVDSKHFHHWNTLTRSMNTMRLERNGTRLDFARRVMTRLLGMSAEDAATSIRQHLNVTKLFDDLNVFEGTFATPYGKLRLRSEFVKFGSEKEVVIALLERNGVERKLLAEERCKFLEEEICKEDSWNKESDVVKEKKECSKKDESDSDDDDEVLKKVCRENPFSSRLTDSNNRGYDSDEFSCNGEPVSKVVDNILENSFNEETQKEESSNDAQSLLMKMTNKIVGNELGQNEKELFIRYLTYVDDLSIDEITNENYSEKQSLIIGTLLNKFWQSLELNKSKEKPSEDYYELMECEDIVTESNDLTVEKETPDDSNDIENCLFIVKTTQLNKSESDFLKHVFNNIEISSDVHKQLTASPHDIYIVVLANPKITKTTSDQQMVSIQKDIIGLNDINLIKKRDDSKLLYTELNDEYIMVFHSNKPSNDTTDEAKKIDSENEVPGVILRVNQQESDFQVHVGLSEKNDEKTGVNVKLRIGMTRNMFDKSPGFFITDGSDDEIKMVKPIVSPHVPTRTECEFTILHTTLNSTDFINAQLPVRVIQVPDKVRDTPLLWINYLVQTYKMMKTEHSSVDIFVSTRFLNECNLKTHTVSKELESYIENNCLDHVKDPGINRTRTTVNFNLNIGKFAEILNKNAEKERIAMKKKDLVEKMRILQQAGNDVELEMRKSLEVPNVLPFELRCWAMSCNGMRQLFENLRSKRVETLSTWNLNLNSTRYILECVKEWHNLADTTPKHLKKPKFVEEKLIMCAISHEGTKILRQQ